MNFFELFSTATERHIARNLKPNAIDSALEAHLSVVRDNLMSSFYRQEKIDYTRNDHQIAYSFHYAPKHATMWFLYSQTLPKPYCGLRFNSIGTGPGSEVFGIVEAHRPAHGTVVEVCCHEENPLWTPIFNEVAVLYEQQTGVRVARTDAATIGDLWSGVPTIGSLILSEVGRSQYILDFLHELGKSVRPSNGLFLDLPTFPGPNDVIYGMPETLRFGKWPNYVPKLSLGVEAKCNADMMHPCVRCRKALAGEPKMLFYPWRFR